MQRSSPNYIGLIKAAGWFDSLTNVVKSFIGGNNNGFGASPLDIRAPRQQQTSPYDYSTSSYGNYADNYYNDLYNRYSEWWDAKEKERSGKEYQSNIQNQNINDAKRLSQEQESKLQRDKQILDDRRQQASQISSAMQQQVSQRPQMSNPA